MLFSRRGYFAPRCDYWLWLCAPLPRSFSSSSFIGPSSGTDSFGYFDVFLWLRVTSESASIVCFRARRLSKSASDWHIAWAFVSLCLAIFSAPSAQDLLHFLTCFFRSLVCFNHRLSRELCFQVSSFLFDFSFFPCRRESSGALTWHRSICCFVLYIAICCAKSAPEGPS
jgi:hypothetical protein